MKTNFMIEIDRKTSGLVITSLVTGDLELAKHSNLISLDAKAYDAASMLMDRSRNFFQHKEYKSQRISEDGLNKMSTIRDIIKRLQMCFLCNQQFGEGLIF